MLGDLKETYNFGEADPSTTTRQTSGGGGGGGGEAMPSFNFGESEVNRPSTTSGGNFQNLDIKVSDEPSFSPKEQGDGDHHESPAAFNYSKNAFGNGDEDGGVNFNQTSNPQQTTVTVKPDKHHKEEGGTKYALKQTFGVGKKSKKGLNDEEKAQVDLERRWKNALAEEERLNKKQAKMDTAASMPTTEPEDNFPPKFLCIRPFLYHSIDAVMPERRRYVTMVFWAWVAGCITLILNMIFTIVTIAVPDRSDPKKVHKVNKPATIVLSIVYVIGIPVSFFTWYWRIYRGAVTRDPAQHFVSLCFLLVDLGWYVFVFIGARSVGVCGIMYAVYVGDQKPKGLVALPIIIIVLSAAFIGFSCYKIVMEFIFYRQDLAHRRAMKRQMQYNVNNEQPQE